LISATELVARTLTSTDIIAVTGCTGWFGRTTLELLGEALGDSAVQRVRAYGSRPHTIELSGGRSLPVRPLADLITDAPAPTVILHYAFLTRERAVDLGSSRYIEANLGITTNVLQALEKHQPRLLVTTSSGAASEHNGIPGSDLANNPYGALKHLDELAFRQAATQIGAGCAIPRIYSVAGPGIAKPELYALSAMITAALGGGPVIVNAQRPVIRSYCGVDEVVALSLWAAANDNTGVFDTGGHILEMAELAEAVSRVVGHGCPVIRPSFDPSLPADRYVGNPLEVARLASACGLRLAGVDELIHHTATGMAAEDHK
jgi:nucleoside-diphosphate-sugar epimerase